LGTQELIMLLLCLITLTLGIIFFLFHQYMIFIMVPRLNKLNKIEYTHSYIGKQNQLVDYIISFLMPTLYSHRFMYAPVYTSSESDTQILRIYSYILTIGIIFTILTGVIGYLTGYF
jgi:hypothetical protein